MGKLTWRRTTVDGRPAHYGVAGAGAPLLFLHGWGMSDRSYAKALRQLIAAGFRVYAPALPGFGGSAELPASQHSLRGYANWVAEFARTVGITEPVTLVGHSFGGGVAIRTAHDHRALVSRLVLVNSIGGSSWSDGRGVLKAIAERPLWDWGLHFPSDLRSTREWTRVLPVVLRDAIPNALRNPGAVWRVARLARTADLTAELARLNRRQLPVVIVWSQHDSVIPRATFLSLQAGQQRGDVVTVPGGHSWLIANPVSFGQVITNVLAIADTDTGAVAA